MNAYLQIVEHNWSVLIKQFDFLFYDDNDSGTRYNSTRTIPGT